MKDKLYLLVHKNLLTIIISKSNEISNVNDIVFTDILFNLMFANINYAIYSDYLREMLQNSIDLKFCLLNYKNEFVTKVLKRYFDFRINLGNDIDLEYLEYENKIYESNY